MLTTFTPLQSLIGGSMIGIIAGLLPPLAPDWQWRASFLAGMITAPLAYYLMVGSTVSIEVTTRPAILLLSGAIVGVGVSYGSGCTSGHGICGLARFSPRSLFAVATFMITAAMTVFFVRHVLGH